MVDTMHDIPGLEAAISQTLPDGWEAKITASGRLYYLDHSNAKSQWLPPIECWPLKTCLPYGWEKASTAEGNLYFINHVTCITTTCHPYILQVEEPDPTKRLVTLQRDNIHGFGFIAGSEGPVVVRSVTEEGPSWGKLLPGDQILQINGEDVAHSRRMYIIEKIMGAADAVQLLVSQPNLHNDGVRSSMLSHNKKQRLMARPLRVRFADNIRTFTSNAHKVPASLSYLPNILKVYLENGQTKSFRYDGHTTVKSVLESISIKLGVEKPQHFALVTEDVRLSASQKFLVLSENLTLRQISSQPDSQYWRCLYRLTFPPKDAYELLLHDSSAFDYFYHQCRNDVICERFGSELEYDLALRLASLNIQQHSMHINKKSVKVSVKMLQKQDGLELFLPKSILENHKKKELRKQICHHLKQNQTFTPPGQKCLTEVQAKLHYLKIIGELKSFACRLYTATSVNTENLTEKSETLLQVSRKMGMCQLLNQEDGALEYLAEFKDLDSMVLSYQATAEGNVDAICQIEIIKTDGKKLLLLMPEKNGIDFANFVSGFYKVYVHNEKSLLRVDNSRFIDDPNSDAPPYLGKHQVVPAGWNYPIQEEYAEYLDTVDEDMTEVIDLRIAPPSYDGGDQSSSDEACSSVSKTEAHPDTTQEEKEKEEGNIACASNAVLTDPRDDDDTNSVISLTDMSFDIREKSDENTNPTEEDGISQLLVILNEESKEKKKTVIEKLDGTAKLKRKRLSLDLLGRKASTSSSDGRPSSWVQCQSDTSDRSSAIEDIDLDIDTESSVSTISFDQEGDLLSRLGEEVDEGDIPVSVIDIPSPDSVASPNQSMQFEYNARGASSEANVHAQGYAISGMGVEKLEREKDEESIEERDKVGGQDDEETLESIAASFKTSEDENNEHKDENISGDLYLERKGGLYDKDNSDSGSLDTLVESFRVDDDDDDDGEVRTKPVVSKDDSVKSQANEETIVGLVEALQEVTQHVDQSLLLRHDEEETLGLSDENGNSEPVVEMDQSDKVGQDEESSSEADLSMSFNDNVKEDEKVMYAYVLEAEQGRTADCSGNESAASTNSDLVSCRMQECKSPHSSCTAQLSVEAVTSSVQGFNLKNEGKPEDTVQVKGDQGSKDHSSPVGRRGNPQSGDLEENDPAHQELGYATQSLREDGADCLPDGGRDSVVKSKSDQPQSLDEAHGIQLAALLALDASLSDKEEEIPRVPMIRDDAESDSGNETIASECVDGPTGEQQNVFLEVSSNGEAEEIETTGVMSSSGNLDATITQRSEVEQVFNLGGKPENSSENFQIDSNTLTCMINVMSTSPGGEQSLVSDRATKTDESDSVEHKNQAEGPGRDLKEKGKREDEDLSQEEKDVIDFLIASLMVQPPPEFDDSLSEDLIPLIPPPSLEGINESIPGDVVKGVAITRNDGVGKSSKPHLVSPQREDTHSVDSVKLESQHFPEHEILAVDEENINLRSGPAKPARNQLVSDEVTDARPTPPPRRKVVKPPRNERSPTKSTGSFKSMEENSPSKIVKKKKVKRSATFSGGNESGIDSELNVNVDPSSRKSSIGWNSPSKYPSVIGESLSRVFSPVKSWNSFKESIRLRSSKPRSRMNLKALWPEVTVGADGSSRYDLKSKSMENIVSWPDDEETVFIVGNKKKDKTKLPLQRSESLADNLQKRVHSSPAAFGKFVHEGGETVMLQTEFFRKAAFGSPAPRRPPPPIPDRPPLSHHYALNVDDKGVPKFLTSPSFTQETGPNVTPHQGVQEWSRSFSSPSTGAEAMSHTDILAAIEAKEYCSLDSFSEAYMNIHMLCHILERTSKGADTSVDPDKFDFYKEQLMMEIREFTNNSKVLVTSINYPVEQLLVAVNECMHSLGRLVQRGQQIVTCLHSVLIASRLIHKVCDVADHFTTMLQMSIDARGKAFNSSNVQGVLRQAQTMAVLLSSLMRSVRMMQNLEPSCDKVG